MDSAYFRRVGVSRFLATPSVQGAWNTQEQHIAPALGLLTHVMQQQRDARDAGHLEPTRLTFDILGIIPIDAVDAAVRVIRPGRTIELVEASLSHDGRPAVILRAWLQVPRATGAVAGTFMLPLADPETLPSWDASQLWPGEFVRTVEIRKRESAPGRAQFWLRAKLPLLAGEPVSAIASAMTLVDVANGMSPRRPPTEVAFPNLDTTVHLFTRPHGDWLGFDTDVSFGSDGAGVTRSVLHDRNGPIGVVAQTLTVRPR